MARKPRRLCRKCLGRLLKIAVRTENAVIQADLKAADDYWKDVENSPSVKSVDALMRKEMR